MTQNPTLSEREAIARIVDHEGYWERLDGLNQAIRSGLANDEQHMELCHTRDEEAAATKDSLEKADEILAVIARRAPVAPAEPVAWRVRTARHDGSWGAWWISEEKPDPDVYDGGYGFEIVELGPIATPAQPSTVTAEGWKMVPVEPTPDMLGMMDRIQRREPWPNGLGADLCPLSVKDRYQAVIAAAPAPPAPSPVTCGSAECLSSCDEGRVHAKCPVASPVTGALVEALRPFAALAAVRYPEEGGAPSWIDLMTKDGEHNEIELRSHVAAWRGSLTLDGDDFRAAERALAAALAAQKAEG